MKLLIILILSFSTLSLNGQLHSKYRTWENSLYMVTASKLNVRDSGSRNGKIIDQLTTGTKVYAMEPYLPRNRKQIHRSFYKIMYGSNNSPRTGFVSTEFLTQIYIENKDYTFFAKSEANGQISLNILKNGSYKTIDKFDIYPFRDLRISLLNTKYLDQAKMVVELKIEDDDSCSTTYSYRTYILTNASKWLMIPEYTWGMDEIGEDIIRIQTPSEPFGERNKINLIKIKHIWDPEVSEPKVSQIDLFKSYEIKDGIIIEHAI